MRRSRNFRQGGGRGGGGGGGGGGGVQVNLTKKALTFFFFSPQLIFRSQMGNFKDSYHFSRFQRGSNIFQGGGGGGGSNFFQGGGGGVQLLIPYRNPYNL